MLGLLAAEQGIISDPWDRLDGSDWWEAVEIAREHGARIPEYDSPRCDGESEPVAVLPPAVRDLTAATTGFDWRNHSSAATLTQQEARDRTADAIADAYRHGDRVLIEALPTLGKSYGAVTAAGDTGRPTTVLTGRGRKEQYDQLKEWCDQHGLDSYVLPSFAEHCPTASGEHGDEWAERVPGYYHREATPKEIHKSAEYVFGEPLPCQRHEGQQCPYAARWDFDPGEVELEAAEVDELTEEAVRKLARTTTYTWDLTNRNAAEERADTSTVDATATTAVNAASAPDRATDPPD